MDERIAVVEALFGAWSSGDADAPRPFLTEDAVLDDVIGGVHRGWPAIRAYFARGLASWPDLRLVPSGEWWSRPDGLAFTWVMSATVTDDRFGPGTAGRRWHAPGMSYVVFYGDRVRHEVDYHDGGSRARSLRGPDT
ncbi:nuclear transport factor 2 family protein [Geodermatophilus sp. SYSU D00691]